MPSIFDLLIRNIEIITISLYLVISIVIFQYWRERRRRRDVEELAWRNEQISERLEHLSKELGETSSQMAESRMSFDDLDETQKRAFIKLIENYENITDKSTFDIVIEINKENLNEFDLGENDDR